MPHISPAECLQWTSGIWSHTPDSAITGVSHDSRKIDRGSLYIAIEGEKHDGHSFIEDAFAAGAVAALVRRGHPELASWRDHALLEVADTRRALIDLASQYRRTLRGTICAITGSVGKTTVKELLRAMLSSLGTTTATAGNWNNDIGLPLSILRMNRNDAFGVFEVAMNRPGEIAALCRILHPHCGVMTTVGMAHSEHFEDVRAIAVEKSSLLKSLPWGGFAVLSNDEEWYDLFKNSTAARICTVAMGGRADYRLELGRNGQIVLVSGNERITATVALPGEYMRRNILLAAAAALELGVDPNGIRTAVESFSALPMRWERRTVAGVEFIVDAYNANPISMQSSIKTFAELPLTGRRCLVLGGMRELGEHSVDAHRVIGGLAARVADLLVLVGDEAVNMRDGALRAGMEKSRIFVCGNAPAAAGILADHLRSGDTVLLKASRLYALEKIVGIYESVSTEKELN